MSALVQMKKDQLPSLAIDENELINVLQNSLYPGAQDDSIKLVVGYCKASGLDPMKKPVHIVPMWDSKTGNMRDTIMPGIGLYRTDAARTGEYAGMSAAEFGPDITEKLGGVEITYPQWCRVMVKRKLSTGQIAEFTATERWKENYAIKGGKEKSIAPNAMWLKRPYAQLEKCAEAQALRKAFPEVGEQSTAAEMEGKVIERDIQTGETYVQQKQEQKPIEYYTDDEFSEKSKGEKGWFALIESGKKTADNLISMIQSKGKLFTDEQKLTINDWQHIYNENNNAQS